MDDWSIRAVGELEETLAPEMKDRVSPADVGHTACDIELHQDLMPEIVDILLDFECGSFLENYRTVPFAPLAPMNGVDRILKVKSMGLEGLCSLQTLV